MRSSPVAGSAARTAPIVVFAGLAVVVDGVAKVPGPSGALPVAAAGAVELAPGPDGGVLAAAASVMGTHTGGHDRRRRGCFQTRVTAGGPDPGHAVVVSVELEPLASPVLARLHHDDGITLGPTLTDVESVECQHIIEPTPTPSVHLQTLLRPEMAQGLAHFAGQGHEVLRKCARVLPTRLTVLAFPAGHGFAARKPQTSEAARRN
mmetsp:Transcript_81583/g.235735  ORF Transcript_81583/g.235735 Transcript_81583/m.235735 type:complete len:206 (-) Transcript_81583:28-645(-)